MNVFKNKIRLNPMRIKVIKLLNPQELNSI